jgi:hypothetical protein
MYVLAKNQTVEQYPYGPDVLRRDNPNTSFPMTMTDAELAEWDVYPVAPQNPPAFDYATQNCDGVNPSFANGVWTETWAVTAATAEQIAQRADEKAAQVRAERTNKLAASDWTQLADAPVDHAAWAAYRQALRDVTEQPGFPWDVNWPTQPE